MLTKSALAAIHKALHRSSTFKAEDFDVDLSEGYSALTTTLRITFRYDSQYCLEAKITGDALEPVETTSPLGMLAFQSKHTHRPSPIEGTMCPGDLTTQLDFKARSISTLTSRISDWLDNIAAEQSASPTERANAAFREEVQAKINDLTSSVKAGEKFSKDESDALKARLDELEKTMKESLEKQDISSDAMKREIAELHSNVAFLKEMVTKLDKKGWATAALTRLWGRWKEPETRRLVNETLDTVIKVGVVVKALGSGDPS